LPIKFTAEALSLPFKAGLKAEMERMEYLLQAFYNLNSVLLPLSSTCLQSAA
jgi:hypothetical protein